MVGQVHLELLADDLADFGALQILDQAAERRTALDRIQRKDPGHVDIGIVGNGGGDVGIGQDLGHHKVRIGRGIHLRLT